MKAVLLYPKPMPSGVRIDLTMKEAFRLRTFLSGANKVTDRDGTIKNILDQLCDDAILSRPIG